MDSKTQRSPVQAAGSHRNDQACYNTLALCAKMILIYSLQMEVLFFSMCVFRTSEHYGMYHESCKNLLLLVFIYFIHFYNMPFVFYTVLSSHDHNKQQNILLITFCCIALTSPAHCEFSLVQNHSPTLCNTYSIIHFDCTMVTPCWTLL